MNSIYLVLDMEYDRVHDDGPNGKAPYGEQGCCCALSAEEHARALEPLRRFCRVMTSSEVAFE